MTDKHERRGLYECEECGLHFSTNKELGRHVRAEHE